MTLRWRWRTAIHEAGHSVAHVALGGQVRQLSVRGVGNTGGRCWPADQLAPWEAAIVSLAGPAAELFMEDEVTELHRTTVIESGDAYDAVCGDWPRARALADEAGFNVEDAAEAAALLVLTNWSAVERVARALRGSRRGIVSGDRVREIVRS